MPSSTGASGQDPGGVLNIDNLRAEHARAQGELVRMREYVNALANLIKSIESLERGLAQYNPDASTTLIGRVRAYFDENAGRELDTEEISANVLEDGASPDRRQTVRKSIYRLIDRGEVAVASRGRFVRVGPQQGVRGRRGFEDDAARGAPQP